MREQIMCGVENQLGTIEPGKLANLVVVDGESYFDPEAKVREVWIDGRVYRGPVEEPKPAEETKAKPSSPEEGEPAKPKEVKPVGRYALNIAWNDGHASGIYSWDYLREVCQCDECRAHAAG